MNRAARGGRRKPGAASSAASPRKPIELSHEAIRDAALALIDRDGIEAFSTRKLGLALGCEAMAIYWYFPSKQALLDAVVDELMAPVALAAQGDAVDWVELLRRIAHAYRGVAHTHPNAFPLLATRRFASEATYGLLERLFELGRERGVPDRDAGRFYRVVSSYCSGFALNELAARPDPRAPATARLRRDFPRVAEVSVWLEPEQLDDIFAFGLELLLEPLARASW